MRKTPARAGPWTLRFSLPNADASPEAPAAGRRIWPAESVVESMETELFVHFAEIAGVFVGFGALISLRSAHVTDVHDVVYLQAVLVLGLWVVTAALVPIAVSRYDVGDRTLWLSSALLAAGLWVIALAVLWRRREWRMLSRSPEPSERWYPVVGMPLHLVIAVSLVLCLLGLPDGVDHALYVTALVAGLVMAGYTLLMSVLSQKHEVRHDTDGGTG